MLLIAAGNLKSDEEVVLTAVKCNGSWAPTDSESRVWLKRGIDNNCFTEIVATPKVSCQDPKQLNSFQLALGLMKSLPTQLKMMRSMVFHGAPLCISLEGITVVSARSFLVMHHGDTVIIQPVSKALPLSTQMENFGRVVRQGRGFSHDRFINHHPSYSIIIHQTFDHRRVFPNAETSGTTRFLRGGRPHDCIPDRYHGNWMG